MQDEEKPGLGPELLRQHGWPELEVSCERQLR